MVVVAVYTYIYSPHEYIGVIAQISYRRTIRLPKSIQSRILNESMLAKCEAECVFSIHTYIKAIEIKIVIQADFFFAYTIKYKNVECHRQVLCSDMESKLSIASRTKQKNTKKMFNNLKYTHAVYAPKLYRTS